MRIGLTGAGLLEAGKSLAWTAKRKTDLRNAVREGFRKSGKSIAAKVQRNVSGAFKVRRAGFIKSYRSTVYAGKPERMPAMAIGSRARFTGIHERGGTVRAKKRLLLIPFGDLRVGPKAFANLVRTLMSRGDGYFREVNGRLILFAENIAENDKTIARFKRVERKARGVKRLQRGIDVPIAVAVPQVNLRKRTDVVGIVNRSIPEIVAAIESEIARSSRGR